MLTLFADKYTPARLPSGSFTVDREGKIVVSTLPSSYPRKQIQEIGAYAIRTFRSAQSVQIPLTELVLKYDSMQIVAKELRGGAIVYLKPVSMS